MTPDEAARLARMAAQIARAFRSLPPDEMAAAVAGHINQFWPVVMRRGLLACAAEVAPDPAVARALPLIRVPPR